MKENLYPAINIKTGELEYIELPKTNEGMALGALEQFTYAYENKKIEVQKNTDFPNIVFHWDSPDNTSQRFTFGLVDKKK